MIVVHGYAELANHLTKHGFSVVAPDLRGHGRSEGECDYFHRFEKYHTDITTG